MRMPGMDGLTLCQRIRARSEVPMHSGHRRWYADGATVVPSSASANWSSTRAPRR
ncbi:hypothetical protein [Micromonospora fulviviridis]|uniref:hypothetical protein n=1 Tax=Micromonospora fulviviridis TaxID=47860 RepID=UPI0037B953C0